MGFEPTIREVRSKDIEGHDYNLLTVGRRSYITSAEIATVQEPFNHILIGSYTAIAHDVSFDILTQHDYTRPSIFPWSNPYSKIFDCDPGSYERRQIIIGHDVWIGQGAVLMGGVRIGNGAVIAANSVVINDVEPYSIVGGNPARHIKYRFDQQTIAAMQRIRWWDWPEERIVDAKDWMQQNAADFARHFVREAKSFPPAGIRDKMKVLRPGDKNYLCLADTKDIFPLCYKVLQEYLETFQRQDAVSLILLGKFQEDGAALQNIRAIIEKYKPAEPPRIVLAEEPSGIALELLSTMDIFITNRQYKTLFYLDFADQYGVSFVSGADRQVFGPRSRLHRPLVYTGKK